MQTICQVVTAGSPSNRLLRFGLSLLTLSLVFVAARNLLVTFPKGVDLEIPLRAAERWMTGHPPYIAESFRVESGAGLPYLYPPFLLPVLAPLTDLPRPPLLVAWSVVCLAAAVFSCRRLGIPWPVVPAAVLWPPFLEGILGGNVQIILFGAFVAAFRWRPGPVSVATRGVQNGEGEAPWLAARRGVLAAVVGALKVSQVHPWLLALRLDRRGAILGAAAVTAVVLLTVPLTGVRVYGDWLAQLSRAADPSWTATGAGVGKYVPTSLVAIIAVLSALLVFAVPLQSAATWTGVLIVLGSPSLHSFGWLFLLPAMVVIRREVALIAAFYLASYDAGLYWLAFFLVAGCLGLGHLSGVFLEGGGRAGDNPVLVRGRPPVPVGPPSENSSR